VQQTDFSTAKFATQNSQNDAPDAQSPVFTALHRMQTRYSDEKADRLSVCPSICPSVCQRVHCDKTEARSVQIFLYHMKDHLA